MEQHSTIKNKELLQDCGVVLFVVIVMFFVHSIDSVHLDLGWIAILGTLDEYSRANPLRWMNTPGPTPHVPLT
jgi:Na+/H+ antiporter NhaD/arsenite permease-like protein